MKRPIYWNNAPVPDTATWTAELGEGWLAPCRHIGGQLALHMPDRQGQGRPLFKHPHPVRQRRHMDLMLCDICSAPLRTRTKIIAGNLRSAPDLPPATMEPAVCAECYRLATQHCPHVKKIAANNGPGPFILHGYELYGTITAPPALATTIAGTDEHSEAFRAALATLPRPAVMYTKLAPKRLTPYRLPVARAA